MSPCFADEKTSFESMLATSIVKTINSLETPEAVLNYVQSKGIKNKDLFRKLIADKSWGEVPTATVEENKIKMSFSNGANIVMEITDFWNNKYKINGYEVQLGKYKTAEERFNFFVRVVQSRGLDKAAKTSLWQIILGAEAHAGSISEATGNAALNKIPALRSMTCNKFITSGCIEVSMAAAMWANAEIGDAVVGGCAGVLSAEQETSRLCFEKFSKIDQIKAIGDLSSFLASNAQIKDLNINCEVAPPAVSLNGEELSRSSDDKLFLPRQGLDGPQAGVMRKLPGLVENCCKNSSDANYDGVCEKFINDHLGQASARNRQFKGKPISVDGRAIK